MNLNVERLVTSCGLNGIQKLINLVVFFERSFYVSPMVKLCKTLNSEA